MAANSKDSAANLLTHGLSPLLPGKTESGLITGDKIMIKGKLRARASENLL